MVHNAAFFTKELTGSHEKRREYVSINARSSGTRMQKRKMWKGR